jgi:tRNA uridine 5-carbamoylmethylation protein Kti12
VILKTKRLIVITGPVGSGKSSTLQKLASCLRRRGTTSAVIDLDDVFLMSRQREDDNWNEPEAWRTARRGSGALAESFFASGLEAVIIDGEYLNAEERQALLQDISADVTVHFYTLALSWDENLRRAKGDPSRSNIDEAWLKRMHDKNVAALEYLRNHSLVIFTEKLSLIDVAMTIAHDVS